MPVIKLKDKWWWDVQIICLGGVVVCMAVIVAVLVRRLIEIW